MINNSVWTSTIVDIQMKEKKRYMTAQIYHFDFLYQSITYFQSISKDYT